MSTTTTHTYGSALSLISVTVPDHLEAAMEVPILTDPQAQGDLLIFQTEAPVDAVFELVTNAGVQVVTGEATGNTHWLFPDANNAGVMFSRVVEDDSLENMTIGYIRVPEGQAAFMIHSDEHGANGIGSGTYGVNGKREMSDILRRIAD